MSCKHRFASICLWSGLFWSMLGVVLFWFKPAYRLTDFFSLFFGLGLWLVIYTYQNKPMSSTDADLTVQDRGIEWQNRLICGLTKGLVFLGLSVLFAVGIVLIIQPQPFALKTLLSQCFFGAKTQPILLYLLAMWLLIGIQFMLSKLSTSVLTYLFFGGCTTVVSVGTFWLSRTLLASSVISKWLGRGFWLLPQTISFIAALVFAFWTNRRWVFRDEGPIWTSFLAFVGGRLVTSLVLEYGGLWLLVNGFGLHADIAKVIAAFLVVIANYFYSKLAVFRHQVSRH